MKLLLSILLLAFGLNSFSQSICDQLEEGRAWRFISYSDSEGNQIGNRNDEHKIVMLSILFKNGSYVGISLKNSFSGRFNCSGQMLQFDETHYQKVKEDGIGNDFHMLFRGNCSFELKNDTLKLSNDQHTFILIKHEIDASSKNQCSGLMGRWAWISHSLIDGTNETKVSQSSDAAEYRLALQGADFLGSTPDNWFRGKFNCNDGVFEMELVDKENKGISDLSTLFYSTITTAESYQLSDGKLTIQNEDHVLQFILIEKFKYY